MQKVAIVLFLGILTGACSVTRKISNETYRESNNTDSGNVLEQVIKQNITSASFFIQKAEIEVNTKTEKKKFLGSIKFEYPDKFLISLKSRTGIEGARIYINKDSIFVNDRINKTMYFGTAFNMKRKFGLNQNVIPIIFGDLVVENKFNAEIGKCEENKLKVDCNVRGITINYNIDCKRRKINQVHLGNSSLKENINVSYNNFIYLNNTLIPRIIDIEDPQYNIRIRIKIIKTEYPWNGDVRFMPGKGYEIIEIL
ncbi:MAG TPA: DUF4292 domain-containing protein [Ignavibacteria bacterium]